jgi:hypothetical protein
MPLKRPTLYAREKTKPMEEDGGLSMLQAQMRFAVPIIKNQLYLIR